MLPSNSTNNHTNVAFPDIESGCYLLPRESGYFHFSYFNNITIREMSHSVPTSSSRVFWHRISSMFFSSRPSSPRILVSLVVQMSSAVKMVRVHAPAIVAAMTNNHPLRDWFPVCNFPRSSVRPSRPTIKEKTTVSAFANCSSPLPTPGFANGNLFKKSIFLAFESLLVFVHKQRIHRSAKEMSAQDKPQSQNDGLNLFEPLAFNGHIKAACSFTPKGLTSI